MFNIAHPLRSARSLLSDAIVRSQAGNDEAFALPLPPDFPGADEASERLGDQLACVLAKISDCYCTFDHRLRLTFANVAALKWMDLDGREAIGLSWWDIFPRTAPCALAFVSAIELGRPIHAEVPSALRPDRWIDLHVYPWRQGARVFFRDITEIVTARMATGTVSASLARAQEEERRRIAADLHDSTAQHLVAISLGLEQLATVCSDTAQPVLDDMRGSLRDAFQEIRSFTFLLHPPDLDRYGLRGALRGLIEGFGRRAGIKVTRWISKDVDGLPGDLQRAVFRVAQEALSNIHRHAGASHVKLTARVVRSHFVLTVVDNGHGMRARGRADPPQTGVGILSMSERMSQLGGTLIVKSDGDGTTVAARVPLDASEQSTMSFGGPERRLAEDSDAVATA